MSDDELQRLKDETIFEQQARFDSKGYEGGISKPFYVNVYGARPHDPYHNDHDLTHIYPFKGRYQTELRGSDLLLPNEFIRLLSSGGTITAGYGKQLLLFGKDHWNRTTGFLADQLGIDDTRNRLVSHVYGRAQRFEKLNDDKTLTIPQELMSYAGMKPNDKIITVGVIYWATIQQADIYKDELLSPEEARSLQLSLSHT